MSNKLATLSGKIATCYEEFVLSDNTSVEHAATLGMLLQEVKNTVEYGIFMRWVNENCKFSHTLATTCIRVYKAKTLLKDRLTGEESVTTLAHLCPRIIRTRKSKTRPKLDNETKVLYILGCGGFYKVGVSDNVYDVKQQLQAGNPVQIKIEYAEKCILPTHLERHINNQLSAYKTESGWVECSLDRILSIISKSK